MEKRVQEILSRITAACKQCFSDNLTGVYLHGSLAFGCFHWERSDIDFIVVLAETPDTEEKEAFMHALLRINRSAPPKGLEMSVVLLRHCRHFVYPKPYELHFSNMHLQRCQRDVAGYCQAMHGEDVDLAAHFAVIRRFGIRLTGMPIREVFGFVPPEAYWSSILEDIRHAQEDILHAPVYTILNLCRALAYRRAGLLLSKAQGASWGIDNLPSEYHPLIRAAALQYSGEVASGFPDNSSLVSFAAYMLGMICTI